MAIQTVGELIQSLSALDPNAPVRIYEVNLTRAEARSDGWDSFPEIDVESDGTVYISAS